MYLPLVAQMVKNLPAMSETWVQSLGQEDPLEKGMATHSSVLTWRIPGTEEPGGQPSMGLHRVGHDWSDLAAAAAWIQWSSLPWAFSFLNTAFHWPCSTSFHNFQIIEFWHFPPSIHCSTSHSLVFAPLQSWNWIFKITSNYQVQKRQSVFIYMMSLSNFF